MGCFDTVTIQCPNCGTVHKEQTKAGNCSLQEYKVIEAPLKLVADLANEEIKCGYCGRYFEIKVQFIANVDLVDKEYEDKDEENSDG